MNNQEHSLELGGVSLERGSRPSCEGHTPMETDEYRHLRSIYAATVPHNYGGRRERRTLDPVDRLPLELATFFIHEALALDGNYASRLIELTAVSSKWQHFLFSTPVLWSELYIDETKPDLLATLASCIHFSNKVPLKISVLRPITDWLGLASLLVPTSRRITQLSISKTSEFRSTNTLNTLSSVSAILHHLHILPNLKGLALDGVLERALLAFDWSQLPINTSLTCHLEIDTVHEYGRFFDINRYHSFHASTPPMPSLLARSISLVMRNNEEEKMTVLDVSEGTLAQLRYSTDSITSCGCREQLMCMAAENIQNLEIEIDISQRGDLVDCLLLLTRLQSLDLTVAPSEVILTQDIVPDGHFSCELRTMGIGLYWMDEELADLSSVGELFAAFTVLYPRVYHFYFRGSTWPTFAASYLENLTDLRSLVVSRAMLGERTTYGTTALYALEELDLNDPPAIRSLYAPSILNLTLDNVESSAQLSGLDLHHLRTLAITTSHVADKLEFTLDPIDYPELRDLEIRFQPTWPPPRFVLSSLPQLVSITIDSGILFSNPHGNQLCCEILYDPEMCPFLQRLHFDACLEWDILFLMLESRNVGMRKVTRIDMVSLPFIPFHLRQPLVHLLAGVKTELPPSVDLSVEETREIICDPTVPGCLFCLANMQPGCQEPVSGRDGVQYQDLNEFYPEYNEPPETAPTVARQWIPRREEMISSWIDSYEEFQQNFARLARCGRELDGCETLYRQYI